MGLGFMGLWDLGFRASEAQATMYVWSCTFY